MGSGDERRLRDVVTRVTADAGYDLEDLTVRSAGRRRVVRVVVDADEGVSLDAAAEISRSISQRLDEAGDQDPAGSTPYTLEVTSPGVGRPLTLPRHFHRARTRLVAMVTVDGRAMTGHVVDGTQTSVRLLLSGRRGVTEIEVPFTDIERAWVKVEFSPPSASVRARLGIEAAPEHDGHDESGDDEDAEDDDDEGRDEDEDDDGERGGEHLVPGGELT